VGTAPFLSIAQRVVLITDVSGQPIGRFMSIEDGTDGLFRNVITTTRCVIAQKSAVRHDLSRYVCVGIFPDISHTFL